MLIDQTPSNSNHIGIGAMVRVYIEVLLTYQNYNFGACK